MTKLQQNARVSFDDITHSYLLDGEKYLMGVTSLMKKHNLSPDYADVPAEILAKAAERGSKVHRDIELYCKGEAVPDSSELKAFKKLGITALANEYLISDNEIVASSIDIVTDTFDLIDIKTTSVLHTEPLSWQLSIYAYLFERQTGRKAGNLYGLHIRGAKAKMVEVERKDDSEIERLFNCEKEGDLFSPKANELPDQLQQSLAELKNATLVVASIKEQLKLAEIAEKALKEQILKSMEQSKSKLLEQDGMKITYIEPTVRWSIDKDRLEEQYPEIYEKFLKSSPISASVRITIKK